MVSEGVLEGTLCKINLPEHQLHGAMVVVRGKVYPHGYCQYIVQKVSTKLNGSDSLFDNGYSCIVVSNANLILV